MKHIKTGSKRRQFEVVAETRAAQCGMMTLQPGGESDDEPSNEHPQSEQWLFVVSGSGVAAAIKNGVRRQVKLRQNSLLVIEKGELHRIRNSGKVPLVTMNFYIPPAYNSDGEPKKRKR